MRATICPFFTGAFQSAKISSTGPDTYVPTFTDVTGCTMPVAVTLTSIGPRSTRAVSKPAASAAPAPASPCQSRRHASSASAASSTRRTRRDRSEAERLMT
jgi:hypothetical protein